MHSNKEFPRLILVADWEKIYRNPSISYLRKLLFNRRKNGLYKAVYKIGKRVYLDEAKMCDWVEQYYEGSVGNV